MPYQDWFMLIGIGGFFILLGLGAIFWGRAEEKRYFNSISTRTTDVREYLEHWPQRPEPGALKVGGWIAITLGLVMLALGVAFLLLK
jgi:hypothetical protein